MADPYWRYGLSADRASIPTPSFPGYQTSEPSTLTSRPSWASYDLSSNTSDFLQKDSLVSRPSTYRSDDIMGIGVPRESGFSGYTTGASLNGYPSSLGDPYLLGRRDVTLGNGPGIPDIAIERPNSFKMVDEVPYGSSQSNVLFVDGLPSDCTRREASHLFRPFFGFREITVVHKEWRHEEDTATVLCFVEFLDAKCALTALEALQGYKFDYKRPDSPVLRIQFAHFPFRLPSDGNEHEQHLAVPRYKGTVGESKGKRKAEEFKGKKKTVEFKGKKRARESKPEAKPKENTKGKTQKDHTCFYCNEKGHWKRNCKVYLEELKKQNTSEASPSEDEDPTCFYCKEKGHWKRNCKVYLEELKRQKTSEASPSGVEDKTCFYCNEKGHWKQNCKVYLEDLKKQKISETSPSGDEDQTCFYCNEKGHWKRNCKAYLEELKRQKTSETSSSEDEDEDEDENEDEDEDV